MEITRPSRAALRWEAAGTHRFRSILGDSGYGPLHAGRWQFTPDTYPTGPLLTEDRGYIDWSGTGDGWEILFQRAPSDPMDGRVKAYRKQARDGSLPPVLLWWVTGLNCYVLVDGHDRLLAALAEDRKPPVLELSLVDADLIDRDSHTLTERYLTTAAAVRGNPAGEAALAGIGRQLGRDLRRLESAHARTRSWPLPGGIAAWRRAAAECAPDWLAEVG